MLADDTSVFFTHKDIRYLFQIVNQELENINQWFVSSKLSLNIKKKTKYSFFHKPTQNENIPFLLPELIINNYKIQGTESIKFFGLYWMKIEAGKNTLNITKTK